MPSGRTFLLSSWSQGALKRLSLVLFLSFRDRVHLSQPFPCPEHVIPLSLTRRFAFRFLISSIAVASLLLFTFAASFSTRLNWAKIYCGMW